MSVYLFLGLGFIRSAAPTYDEPVHLASGYTGLRTGRFLNAMDPPPLAEMWSAAALLPFEPHVFTQHPDWLKARVYHYGDLFLYHNRLPAEEMLYKARAFGLCTLGLALALALAGWAWRLAGLEAAAASLLCMSLCPAILSNFAIVGTDGASAALFFAACALAAEGARREEAKAASFPWWLAAGAAAGLALASKFNMILLPPLLFGLGALDALAAKPRRPPPASLWALVLAAAALLCLAYSFRLGLWWDGLTATLRRLDDGRSSFFLGRHSTTGSWAYFPVALALKTPLPLLALAVAGLAASREHGRRAWWFLAPPAVYLAAALTAKVQIGYRHVLPIVPFLLLWAGLGAARLGRAGLAGRAGVAALGAWLAWGVFAVHPHQLAFFNELAGGPAGGYRYLVDSNLDWGQALKPLGAELSRLGGPPVYLSYFGTADPEAYGIRYQGIGMIDNLERVGSVSDPAASGRVLLAISATNLQSTYYKEKDAFSWLGTRKPLSVIGHAIFLYDLTRDADARRRIADFLPPEFRRSLLALPKVAAK